MSFRYQCDRLSADLLSSSSLIAAPSRPMHNGETGQARSRRRGGSQRAEQGGRRERRRVARTRRGRGREGLRGVELEVGYGNV